MGKAIPIAVRQKIVRECKAGKSLSILSEELGLSYDGVCKIWRNYKRYGEESLQLQYANSGRKAKYDEGLVAHIKGIREEEGDRKLGAPYIRSKMLSSNDYGAVPHERTMQRWLRKADLHHPPGRGPKSNNGYSVVVHETWQGDAKENLCLLNGQPACYFSIGDEASGTFLHGEPFPPGQD